MQQINRLVEKQTLHTMFYQNRKSVVFNFISCVFIFLYFELTGANYALLGLWLMTVGVVSAIRFSIATLGSKKEKLKDLKKFHHYLASCVFLNGLLWGGFYWLYYPDMTDAQSLFTAMALIGGVTFAVVSFTASPLCYFSFLLPVTLPAIYVNVLSAKMEFVLFGVAIGLYSLFIMIVFFSNRNMLLVNSKLMLEQGKLINKFKRLNAKLKMVSTTDSLTGLANRREFNTQFHAEWLRAIRTNTPVTIILVDVDYFKEYNDHYGHLEGDHCLKQIGGVLKKNVKRNTDFVARFGGDELVIVLHNTDGNGALEVVHNIEAALTAEPMPHQFSPYGRVTLSIGIATCTPFVNQAEQSLFALADEALYDVKQKGRNNHSLKTFQKPSHVMNETPICEFQCV